MLNENIKAIRKSKGLSQEELAVKLNVVRQTISKWEQGLSVPDSDMLISINGTTHPFRINIMILFLFSIIQGISLKRHPAQ
jgi:transcriptional regulator with XRE-family HTH domain